MTVRVLIYGLGILLSACLWAAGGTLNLPESLPADFRQYVSGVYEKGMTEDAEGDLRMVAGVVNGSTIYKVERQGPDEFSHMYSAVFCPRPGMTAEQREKLKEMIAEAEKKDLASVAAMKPAADSDHSGFVSSEEGRWFRKLYFFGREAEGICGFVGADKAALVKGMHLTDEAFEKSLQEYRAFPFREDMKCLRPLLDGTPQASAEINPPR